MEFVMYYSKLNLTSHIFDVYKKRENLDRILNLLHKRLENDITYVHDEQHIDGTEVFQNEAYYRIGSLQKDNHSVSGYFYRKNKKYLGKEDTNGIVKKVPYDNTESVCFYLDIKKEIVAFYTVSGIGYNQFNLGFEGIVNQALKEDGYVFDVDLISESMDLDYVYEELKKLGKISEIRIEIKPPNPGDSELAAIMDDPELFLDKLQDSRVNKKSTILKTNSKRGINIDSDLVKEELEEVRNIHSSVSDKSALEKKYATIEAIGEIRNFSTKKNKPKTSTVNGVEVKLLYEFIAIAKELVSLLF